MTQDPSRNPGHDLAEQVNQAKLATLGMMVAGLAHELNSPLGALNSNHDLLRRAIGRLQSILADEVVEPHELEEVRRVVRALGGILDVNDLAVERMDSLVRSLRNFGRIDRAELDYADVHEGIDSTLAILSHELKEATVVRAYGELPRILCFPQQLNQVFLNLLVNAAQASPAGGRITITTTALSDGVRIQVADQGLGIGAEHLERIFDPGFTTRAGRIGMGLGLTISRQIVERHGGRIRAESELGHGATFTLDLPLRPPDDVVAADSDPPSPEIGP